MNIGEYKAQMKARAANMTEKPNAQMLELLPCPFCSGPAYQVQIGNEATKNRGFEVGCRNCRVKITDLVITHSLEWIKPRNTANWNTRAAPSPHPRREEIATVLNPVAFTVNDRMKDSDTKVEMRASALRKADAILALFAVPPPAGADAVREALESIAAMVPRACGHRGLRCAQCGHAWRPSDEPEHHASNCAYQIARSALPAPQPQEKPDGEVTSAKGKQE